jgi:hypothetical protein
LVSVLNLLAFDFPARRRQVTPDFSNIAFTEDKKSRPKAAFKNN